VSPGRRRCLTPDFDTMTKPGLPLIWHLGVACSDLSHLPVEAPDVWIHCASDESRLHPSTYVPSGPARLIRTIPTPVAQLDYCDDPGFSPSTPVIFPLFSSDFTDLACLVNTLTLHVATVI
jgi:hypothetical protein